MKNAALALWLLLASLAAVPAHAGDPGAAPGGWTGFYLGINGGGGWGTSRWTASPPASFRGPSDTGDFGVGGGLAGGTIGYDWQVRHIVYGVVGDIDWADIHGSETANCPPTCTTRESVIGTARARFGYDFGAWLPYLTGGLAIGDVRASYSPATTGTSDTTRLGYAVGLGAENRFAPGWSWSVEYLFEDLGSASCPQAVCSGTGGPPVPSEVKLSTSSVRIGLNRRF